MASLGTFTLLASFVVSAYAAIAAIAGARRASRSLVDSAVGAFYLVAGLLTVSTAVIIHAFVTDDYSIKYVQHYSGSFQPLVYKLTAFWGGLDGSIMFWAFLLAIFGSLAVYANRERQRELIPYVVAVISFVQMFFLFLMVVHKNPFDTFLVSVPPDGRGMNPLLQNLYMVIHPPALYVGFVGMTIPYAFAMAALITGHLDDSWLRAVRRWMVVSWLFLSFGLALGMIWAYEVLGWGGYWGWDPVENAGLLPWFTATAFLHSAIVQERRGMLRVWNVTLVIVTFFLTIFGTFMTRSGVVQSVHAFGEDRTMAIMFSVFMLLVLAVSFGYVIRRLGLLRGRHGLKVWVSREGAVVANNWVMLFAALFVLFATMFPTISETLMGERLTVGPPFFNTWMLPIGLVLLFLTGVGPLLAWRGSSAGNLKDQFLWPVVLAVATPVALRLAGIPLWPVGLCFALCVFVMAAVFEEFLRGAAVRRRATGSNYLVAMAGLVARSKRRYGGYIVHLGIVLMFVGFTGEAFKIDQQVLLRLGQQASVGHYVIRNDGIRVTDDGQKQMITGHLAVLRDGREIDQVYPGKWLYRQHEQEPVSQIAIRRSPVEDLYIVMPDFELQNQSVSLQVVINPLVDWIWVGFCLLALGALMTLLPDEVFGSASARVPDVGSPAFTSVAPASSVDKAVSAFQPWHLFLIMTLLATAASAVAVRGTRPANVVFICLTVAAAGLAAYGVYRMLWPLVQPEAVESPEMLGGQTRAALEREKALWLRAITELEFDRAMGKVSESDWQEMTARLRTRAIRVISQLDSGSAAYREVIERELTARKAAAQGPAARGAAAVGRSAAPLLCLAVALGGALVASPARAQMGGTGGTAGMPDARVMSGIPRPDPSLPAGTVSVRLVRGQVSNLVVGQPVEFIVNGKSGTVTTDDTGHAVAKGLEPGATVRAVATVGSERIDSQEFQVPPDGGIVIMLVVSDNAAAAQMARGAVEGTVTIGGQSRIAAQFEDEELQVYYLFDIVNKMQEPVKTAEPVVFVLPPGALNTALLEGSTPKAVAKGSTVTVAGPFPPGVTSVLVAYSMPPVARVSIRQKLPLPMEQVAVMVEKVGSVVLSSPQLTTIREGSNGGKVFVIGTGPGLKAGDVLALDVSGLPHPATWPRDTALALAVLTLAVGAWGAARTGGRSAESAARQHLEARREQVFAELLALDARRQAGKVGAGEAAERRGHLVTELERIYGELDTGGADARADQGRTA